VPEFVKIPLKLLALVPPSPSEEIPTVVGTDHEYVVPTGTGVPVGVKLKETPVQVVREVDKILATGNTLTVTVNPAEVHPPGTAGVTK
jgi:hypothetical protein